MRNPFDIEIDRLKARVDTDMHLLSLDVTQIVSLIGEADPGLAATRLQTLIGTASMLLGSLSAWHAMREGKELSETLE